MKAFEQMFDPLRWGMTLTPILHRSTDWGRRWSKGEWRQREEQAVRRYDDPVEVRRGADEGPEQFLWRGRLWQVREVVAHWVESRPWFVPASACSCTVDPTAETDVWRVAAARGRVAAALQEQAAHGADPGYGVFDLAFDWSTGDWRLAGAVD